MLGAHVAHTEDTAGRYSLGRALRGASDASDDELHVLRLETVLTAREDEQTQTQTHCLAEARALRGEEGDVGQQAASKRVLDAVLFKDLMESLAREFMVKHPNVRVTLRAPEEGYEQILQRNLRDAITSTLPDVAFHGLNRQRTLAERNIPVNLKPFMDADPQTR